MVRNKALAAGAGQWIRDLPELAAALEREWSIAIGPPNDATEAFVAEATLSDGAPAMLKLHIPRPGDHAGKEITVLRLARGQGCARLLRADATRGALLLKRLGPSLHQLKLPIVRRQEILCSAAFRDHGSPSPTRALEIAVPPGCRGSWRGTGHRRSPRRRR